GRADHDLFPALAAEHDEPRPLLLEEGRGGRDAVGEETLGTCEDVFRLESDGGRMSHGSKIPGERRSGSDPRHPGPRVAKTAMGMVERDGMVVALPDGGRTQRQLLQ